MSLDEVDKTIAELTQVFPKKMETSKDFSDTPTGQLYTFYRRLKMEELFIAQKREEKKSIFVTEEKKRRRRRGISRGKNR
jgi:hypothetical protein